VAAPLPHPTELGFPDKFARWYPDQLDAIDRTVFNTRRFTALGMPTGSGKSVTGIAVALLHPEVTRAIYLTSTKGLQDQLATDFAELGLVDLRGQRNYPCIAVEPGAPLNRYRHGRFTVGCDEGPCHSGVWCPRAPDRKTPNLRPDCPYYQRVFDARRTSLVSSNYAMWFAANEYAEGLGAFDLLILDEAHDADKELEAFLTVEITADDARTAGSKMPHGSSLQNWKDWATQRRSVLRDRLEQLELMPPADVEGVRERRKLKAVFGKLERLADIEPLKWVVDDDGHTAKFCPLRVAGYAESVLFRGVKHVLLMSATLTHKTLSDLGVSREDYAFWEAPSRFPVDRRPIISVETTPAVRVNARMDEDDKVFWMRRIDRLIEPRRRLGWNGIIHTVSFQRMKELLARSDHRDIMIVHDTGGTREAIREFKESNGPRILVSPSIVTGYDFPDDECRFQIIGKVPIPDMRGPIMKARGELDKEYSGYLAMQKLVQACGRGMRGPNDWCETFIVDDTFGDWFFSRNRKYCPRWFVNAIERVDSLPDPLVVV
jgi:ATP-dependent DNA helicase DinG